MTIFLTRLRQNIRQQYRFFYQIMDWTTWLYVVIPVVLFAVYFYKETIWIGEFGIFNTLSFPLFLFVFLFIQGFASIRTWTYEADALFFMRQPSYKQLKRFGACISVLRTMLILALLLLLLTPFITAQYDVTLWMLWLGGLSCFMVMAVMTSLWKAKWVSYILCILTPLIQTMLFVLAPTIGVLYAVSLLLVMGILYETWHVQSTRFFAWQLQKEKLATSFFQQAVANVSLNYYGLSVSTAHEKKVRWPQFKWHSRPLYNLGCKTFVRDSQYRSGYARFLAVQVPIYIAAPASIDFLVVIALYAALHQWFRHVVFHIFDAPFFRHYRLPHHEQNELLQFMRKRFVYIPFAITATLVVMLNIWPIY